MRKSIYPPGGICQRVWKTSGGRELLPGLNDRGRRQACPYFGQIRFGIGITRYIEQFQLGQVTQLVRKPRKLIIGKVQDLQVLQLPYLCGHSGEFVVAEVQYS